ncbi:MAG TPA: hypothetical protein VE860_19210 [Chthoniobacterales bacterium]|jgi:hypothetical protein|nr:hypothetical protein [Chthoniobacterales bacterium]
MFKFFGRKGLYNLAGDLGKAALPGATSFLLIVLPWHEALWAIAALGLTVVILIANLEFKRFAWLQAVP